jgi:hypothetical protein
MGWFKIVEREDAGAGYMAVEGKTAAEAIERHAAETGTSASDYASIGLMEGADWVDNDTTLPELQAGLPWGANDYSKEFLADPRPHKWYDHARKHLDKASGRLGDLCEEMDHDPSDATVAAHRADDEKRLADVMICLLRLANTHPGGKIDLVAVVGKRLAQKFSG